MKPDDYGVKDHARHINIRDARFLGPYLEKIRSKHGKLTPKIFVAEARPKDSPLHRFLEWDNSIAGERYRLNQAGSIIREVTITIKLDPRFKARKVQAVVRVVKEDRGVSYEPVVEVMSTEFYREQVLARALAELEAFKKKYRELKELADVFRAADKIKRKKAS